MWAMNNKKRKPGHMNNLRNTKPQKRIRGREENTKICLIFQNRDTR
jgi:hypothetical protein